MAEKDSFIFYRSFFEASAPLEDVDKLTLFNAIIEYALDQKEPELAGIPRAMFCLIKPLLEAGHKNFVNGHKGADYGKLGGRPKRQKPPPVSENNPPPLLENNPPETPNYNYHSNSNYNLDSNLSNGGFDILKAVQYNVLIEAAKIARIDLEDIEKVAKKFNDWIRDKKIPDKPDKAFISWANKFYKR
jgi:hypothetical protein